MKVFITGGTGFLGSHLSRALAEKGIENTFIGRNEKLGRSYESKLSKFEKCDVNEESKVRALMRGHTHVVHSAGLTKAWGKPETYETAHIDGTVSVLKAAAENGIQRFIQISTPSIYMSTKSCVNVRESDPLPKKFLNDYSRTKYIAEEKVLEFEKNGLFTVRFRPSGIFGPGDQTIIPRLVETAKKGFIPVVGDGSTRLDLTYVTNVVDAILTSLECGPHVRGKVYNLTNDEPVSNVEFMRTILNRLGIQVVEKKMPFWLAYGLGSAFEFISKNFQDYKDPLLSRQMVVALARSRTLNIDEAKKDLGYKPRVSMSDGIDRMVTWWKAKA